MKTYITVRHLELCIEYVMLLFHNTLHRYECDHMRTQSRSFLYTLKANFRNDTSCVLPLTPKCSLVATAQQLLTHAVLDVIL